MKESADVIFENIRTGNQFTVLRAWTMPGGQFCYHLSNGAYIPQSAIAGHWRVIESAK